MVYVQVTRGVARRDFVFPPEETAILAHRHRPRASTGPRPRRSPPTGIAVVSLPDNRWDRVDIKSVSLLPNALARQAAKEKGAREAWFVDARRLRHRRRGQQCLDRDARGQPRHAACEAWHSSRRDPHDAARPRPARRRARRSSAPSRSTRRRPRARPSSPPPRPSSCRSCASTVTLSGTACPDRSTTRLRREFHSVAESAV